eukprot:CAMPEP_0195511276 /NCGR_PEP_ID=MMETSP0794_2-20130614/3655_1 /TAXON_ID=515487 /ORGANISM="Stephanopyxis turris, Strain CCMP 815" /LENGTH=719 /DNA_ID=CAMNT_0040638843 /DNA_START=158 /DNA_END=2318 /DNA_ORIENTATION=-
MADALRKINDTNGKKPDLPLISDESGNFQEENDTPYPWLNCSTFASGKVAQETTSSRADVVLQETPLTQRVTQTDTALLLEPEPAKVDEEVSPEVPNDCAPRVALREDVPTASVHNPEADEVDLSVLRGTRMPVTPEEKMRAVAKEEDEGDLSALAEIVPGLMTTHRYMSMGSGNDDSHNANAIMAGEEAWLRRCSEDGPDSPIKNEEDKKEIKSSEIMLSNVGEGALEATAVNFEQRLDHSDSDMSTLADDLGHISSQTGKDGMASPVVMRDEYIDSDGEDASIKVAAKGNDSISDGEGETPFDNLGENHGKDHCDHCEEAAALNSAKKIDEEAQMIENMIDNEALRNSSIVAHSSFPADKAEDLGLKPLCIKEEPITNQTNKKQNSDNDSSSSGGSKSSSSNCDNSCSNSSSSEIEVPNMPPRRKSPPNEVNEINRLGAISGNIECTISPENNNKKKKSPSPPSSSPRGRSHVKKAGKSPENDPEKDLDPTRSPSVTPAQSMPMYLPTFKPATGCTNASDFIVRCFVARLRSGITVFKHGRNRWCKSRLRILHVHSDGRSLSWRPAIGEPTSSKRPPKLDLSTCLEVRHAWSPDPLHPLFTGTPILRQKCEAANAHKSFALIFPKRTVDVTAVTADQCKVLMEGFSALCFRLQVANLAGRAKDENGNETGISNGVNENGDDKTTASATLSNKSAISPPNVNVYDEAIFSDTILTRGP